MVDAKDKRKTHLNRDLMHKQYRSLLSFKYKSSPLKKKCFSNL